MTTLKRAVAVLSLSLASCSPSIPDGGTTGTSCSGSYACSNGACKCDTGGHTGDTCCSPSDASCTDNKCDTYCKTCSST